jgi:hypothetical protein
LLLILIDGRNTMRLRHLAFPAAAVLASFGMVGTAHADAGGGAYHVACTRFPGAFPGATGGDIIITPAGNINANCTYPGPASGGGADAHQTYENCVITPAGNFQCH